LLGQQAGSAILNILKNKAQDVIELVIIDTELKIRKSTQTRLVALTFEA
jgi:DNA-binding LacI/PurR family transcriptional regulator